MNTRPQGYYWVKFDYPEMSRLARQAGLFAPGRNVPEHWEVASWDAAAESWALVGSNDPWYDHQILVVGPKVEAPG